MFAAAVIAEVVAAVSRQRYVKLIYGILGSPGANIFHLYFKRGLAHGQFRKEPPLHLLERLWDSQRPPLIHKTGLNLKEALLLWKNLPVSQHVPPQYYALWQQRGPAVALCPMVKLSAALRFQSEVLCRACNTIISVEAVIHELQPAPSNQLMC